MLALWAAATELSRELAARGGLVPMEIRSQFDKFVSVTGSSVEEVGRYNADLLRQMHALQRLPGQDTGQDEDASESASATPTGKGHMEGPTTE
jgi:hypothetical protein